MVPLTELPGMVGKELGPSEWLEITQERVNQFAECTGDHQFIHVDEEMAKMTPFGGTIAHGFLTLSLIVKLTSEYNLIPEGIKMGVNYGLDKVRFLKPVRVGKRIRSRSKILEVREKGAGQWMIKSEVTVEIEGEDKPAMVAETIVLMVV